MEKLNAIKATFLKRVLAVHQSTQNRLVYSLCDTPLLTEEFQSASNLPMTKAFVEAKNEELEKRSAIDPDFMLPPAMTSNAWRAGNFTNRHLVTRYSVHGFHHLLCLANNFHEPSITCLC